MDLRIKALTVIPHPKYINKWLVITGNSIGTIRVYSFDDQNPNEFQYEGQDATIHGEKNPILSLTSSFKHDKNRYFELRNELIQYSLAMGKSAPTIRRSVGGTVINEFCCLYYYYYIYVSFILFVHNGCGTWEMGLCCVFVFANIQSKKHSKLKCFVRL